MKIPIFMDKTYISEWLGRTEECSDLISFVPVAGLSATLDKQAALLQTGDVLPPLWHWMYFFSIRPQSEIGHDGHPERGGFLPPVQLPRRMWAGGRLQWHRPVRVGDLLSRVSSIVDISSKEGRTGSLVFVLVRHEISDSEGVLVTEEQDIVYRDKPTPLDIVVAPRAADVDHDWIREIEPDPVLLFRYSALTFNGHRIHYDRPYAIEEEKYPGLVVHGPLIATLLIDLISIHLPEAIVSSFSFRAVKPTFDNAPFFVCGRVEKDGKTVSLWAKDNAGWLAMSATATFV